MTVIDQNLNQYVLSKKNEHWAKKLMMIKCIKGINAKKLYLENQMMLDCLSPTNVLTYFILFYFI